MLELAAAPRDLWAWHDDIDCSIPGHFTMFSTAVTIGAMFLRQRVPLKPLWLRWGRGVLGTAGASTLML